MTETTASPADERFGLAAQLLHWVMAVAIIAMLVLGALLVGSLGDYPMVLAWHKAIGLLVLVLAVLRIGNRIWHRPPPLSLAGPERFIAAGSELAMYTLFLAQPVIGWALVSASGCRCRSPDCVFRRSHPPACSGTDYCARRTRGWRMRCSPA